MIHFKTIRYKNFLSTGNYFNEIKLDAHPMTLISGVNGSGKTTAWDALTFALYGKPHRNINKPTLVNSINQKDCIVEVEFSIGKDDYLVRRGIKPSVFEILKNGTLINQDSKSKDYQKFLEQSILRINFQSFTQIIFLGSAGFIPFMELTPVQRREVIEDILDIKIFSKMNIVVKKRLAETQQNLWLIENAINIAKEKHRLHKEYLQKKNQDKQKIIEENENKISEIQKQCETLELQIETTNNKISKLLEKTRNKDKIYKQLLEIDNIFSSFRSKKQKISSNITFYTENDNCPTCKQGISKDFCSEMIQKEQSRMTEINDAFKQLENEKQKILDSKTSIDTILSEVSQLQTELSTASNSLKISIGTQKTLMEQNKRLHKEKDEKLEDSEISNIELTITQKQQEQAVLQQNKHMLERLQILLKDSGIKAKIIRQYLPIMNKLINKYLTEMDFFVNFTLDENFSEIIKSRHRDEFTYASFSEGEKQRIDVALLLTWREIARLKNSANTNLLVMDEIFDKSLDQSAIQEVTKLLRGLSKKSNIFVISHRADIHADKFDNSITFTKNGDFSAIHN